MNDLAVFVTARLDEDEAVARDAYYEGQRWISEEEGVYRWPDDQLPDDLVQMADRKRDASHIARWEPARAIREVEGFRKIVTEHEAVTRLATLTGQELGFLGWYREWVLKNLAGIWSDHPDYREEWKP